MPDDGRQKQDAGEAATNRDRPDTVGRKCEYKVLGANGHLCGTPAVRQSPGKGKLWPVVLLQQVSARRVSTVRERQLCTVLGHSRYCKVAARNV